MGDISYYQSMFKNSVIDAGNATYIEDLYEQYLQNKSAVPEEWQTYFASFPQAKSLERAHSPIRDFFKQYAKQSVKSVVQTTADPTDIQIQKLTDAYRRSGFRAASLDPLNIMMPENLPELDPRFYGLSDSPLVTKLKHIYTNHIGFEWGHLTLSEEVNWLTEYVESTLPEFTLSPEKQKSILHKLIAADTLEKYLGNKYVGQKRFSIEGSDILLPMLSHLLEKCAPLPIEEVLVGIAHRGRLNLLLNLFGKPPTELYREFEGKYPDNFNYSGDVKYHIGHSTDLMIANKVLHISMAFNPSHLEIVNPVIEGSARARQDKRLDDARQSVLPVVVHGDAAFCGQGVVMETFNLSQTRGFYTGGSIHVITNNQIGFTTSNPRDSRSSRFSADIAKMIEAPIFHVNGEDPIAVMFVTELAINYRTRFRKDVVIDLITYRRHGHNEADEPMITQPLMYQVIKEHPVPYKLFAGTLIKSNIITADYADKFRAEYRDKLDAGKVVADYIHHSNSGLFAEDWKRHIGKTFDDTANMAMAESKLIELASKIIKALPENFALQPQVAREWEMRGKMAVGEIPMNWGFAENLAYATLLDAGFSVRFSGQDCRRGTFSHRHAVFHDQKTGQALSPIEKMFPAQNQFTIIDSLLSEEAVVGFEYGYSATNPNTLVIWEAQFGDFANGAQVVIDQFISSGEQKWGRLSSLVMLLPHGYEGMGPEHSSARLERYLQLCAENNMRVVMPTLPSQIFHLLRRQVIHPARKPLIVFSPKSLLRHKSAVSQMQDLASGEFYPVITDPLVDVTNSSRLILCSGKIYFDLVQQRDAYAAQHQSWEKPAIIRIEELYPFPENFLKTYLHKGKKLKEVVWCQEEPENQGAFYYMTKMLSPLLKRTQKLLYSGRKESAAPSEGYASIHTQQQKQLVDHALQISSSGEQS